MKKEVRTVVYDDELHIEAYRFEGIVQPFPNHFHEYYVIGFMEDGERILSCKNQEYTITREPVSYTHLAFPKIRNNRSGGTRLGKAVPGDGRGGSGGPAWETACVPDAPDNRGGAADRKGQIGT